MLCVVVNEDSELNDVFSMDQLTLLYRSGMERSFVCYFSPACYKFFELDSALNLIDCNICKVS